MRFLLIIVTVVLFAEYSNLIQVFKFTDADAIVLCYDTETEEEKKTEKDSKKFDKHHYYYEYFLLLAFITSQKKFQHQAGLCLKGHCTIVEQPPEVRI